MGWPAIAGTIASALIGAYASSMQPGPAAAVEKTGRKAIMPEPVPGLGQQGGQLDWEQLFAMLAQQSTPDPYSYLNQLNDPAFWQQAMGGQQSPGGGQY